MKRRVYAGLVTSRPPKEIAGSKDNKPEDYILQELSSGKPELYVPNDDSDLADRTKQLLLFDAALTPAGMPESYGIPSWALDAARVMRADPWVKTKSTDKDARAGFMPSWERVRTDTALRQKGEMQYMAAVAKIEAMYGCYSEGFTSYLLKQFNDERPIETWEDVVNCAQRMAERADKNGEENKPRGKPKSGEDEGEGDGEGGIDNSGDDEGQDEGEGKAKRYVKREDFLDNHGFSDDPWVKGCQPPQHGNGKWGTLVNKDAPDILPMRNMRKRGYRRRPEMEGVVPSGWHRLFVDRKLFRGAPMKGGQKGRGTILVDMSGSMSWDYQSFEALLDLVPECSVYGYSGEDNLQFGRLVLLADRGRCAKMDAVEKWRRNKGANLVDGPALMFLAHMPSPRVWISDGYVTGRNENQGAYVRASAAEIEKAGNIKRVLRAADAKRIIYG